MKAKLKFYLAYLKSCTFEGALRPEATPFSLQAISSGLHSSAIIGPYKPHSPPIALLGTAGKAESSHFNAAWKPMEVAKLVENSAANRVVFLLPPILALQLSDQKAQQGCRNNGKRKKGYCNGDLERFQACNHV
nr:hypothetical protein Iba_chr12bCG4790 [Ipomoea batatas]